MNSLIVVQEDYPETKCSLANSILPHIWSKKIDYELFHNITFFLLSDSMDVS